MPKLGLDIYKYQSPEWMLRDEFKTENLRQNGKNEAKAKWYGQDEPDSTLGNADMIRIPSGYFT